VNGQNPDPLGRLDANEIAHFEPPYS
jgi:hypothetical protein